MPKRNNELFHVFDFDGTIAIDGKITDENLRILKKIPNKILNTSRGIDDLPARAKSLFRLIMTLNGSQFYRDEKLVNSFEVFNKKTIDSLIDIAISKNYNIAFNSTQYWQNVSNSNSVEYMQANNIKFSNSITNIPTKIFLISLSNHDKIDKSTFRFMDPHFIAIQSPRMIEISLNTKANITLLFSNIYAYGDNENDRPLLKVAKKFKWIKSAKLEIL